MGSFLLVVGVGALLGGSSNGALSAVGICQGHDEDVKKRGERVGLTALLKRIAGLLFAALASFLIYLFYKVRIAGAQ